MARELWDGSYAKNFQKTEFYIVYEVHGNTIIKDCRPHVFFIPISSKPPEKMLSTAHFQKSLSFLQPHQTGNQSSSPTTTLGKPLPITQHPPIRRRRLGKGLLRISPRYGANSSGGLGRSLRPMVRLRPNVLLAHTEAQSPRRLATVCG